MSKSGKSWNLVPLPDSNTERGERGVLKAPGLDQEEGQLFSYSVLHQNQPTSWLVHIQKHYGCWDKPRATRIHLIHHGLDSGEATTFPHTLFSTFAHGTCIQMAFCPRLPRRSLKTVPVWTPGTSGGHNSHLRPPIGMRSEANLYLSSRAFQWCAALHLHTPGSGRFSTFSGQESNCQFDSRPFFRP